MKINNQSLKQFAESMASCLAAGLPPQKALTLSARGTECKALAEAVAAALPRFEHGMAISEALEPEARLFPRHVLPVLRAGELSGRQVEAYQLVRDHCQRIGPSLQAVRDTWMIPLVCVAVGWAVRAAVYVYFGRYATAMHFLEGTLGSAALLAATAWWLLSVPAAKLAIDRALLQVPLLRETEIRLATVLFFSTFRLVYDASELGVFRMFDLALAAVRSEAIRRDFLRARKALEQDGTLGEAFAEPQYLEWELKTLIEVGAVSGKLDQTLTQIVEKQTWQLELSLRIFNQFFHRAVAFAVAMSIVETILICLL